MYKKEYAILPTEILARAFELFAADKLGFDNKIANSNFFSGIYPTNKEKEVYNELFDILKEQFNNRLTIKPNIKNKRSIIFEDKYKEKINYKI